MGLEWLEGLGGERLQIGVNREGPCVVRGAGGFNQLPKKLEFRLSFKKEAHSADST